MVPRDYRWAGRRIVCEDAAYLAEWPARPAVALERTPDLLGCAWVPEAQLDAIGRQEPPDLRGVLPPCRYRTRCERAVDACDEPPLPRAIPAPGELVACRRPF